MPSLNVFNNDAAQASLAPPASVPERYAELWWYSGSDASTSSTVAGNYAMAKGASGTAPALSTSSSAQKLYTLNSSWSATTKFAFEAAVWSGGGSYVGYAALWDMTTNTIVSSSQISVTGGTATVVRSGQFTLTSGHVYGVTLWGSSSSGGSIVTDASLIIFS